jgi:hypothetical protein
MSARIKPHKVRGRQLEEVREKNPDGRIVVHHRTVDTLGKMLRAGTITGEMHDAAKDFQAAFIVANLDPLRELPILRVQGTGRDPDLNDRQLHARRRVHASLEALGGISSPAGSCVWHVVGLQRSVREWAIRQGWGGRPVRQEQAQGILVAALGNVERVLGGQLADMTFCDPPYNVDYANSPKDKLRGKHRPIMNDNLGGGFQAFLQDACTNILAVTKGAVYVCMSSSELHALQRAFVAAGGKWSTFVIWAKHTLHARPRRLSAPVRADSVRLEGRR